MHTIKQYYLLSALSTLNMDVVTFQQEDVDNVKHMAVLIINTPSVAKKKKIENNTKCCFVEQFVNKCEDNSSL